MKTLLLITIVATRLAYSISTVLAMTYDGARGETSEQMAEAEFKSQRRLGFRGGPTQAGFIAVSLL